MKLIILLLLLITSSKAAVPDFNQIGAEKVHCNVGQEPGDWLDDSKTTDRAMKDGIPEKGFPLSNNEWKKIADFKEDTAIEHNGWWYLPFRNMIKMTWTSSGWNKIYIQINKGPTVKIFMDLWGTDLNAFYETMEGRRKTRVNTITEAVKKMSELAGSYSGNIKLADEKSNSKEEIEKKINELETTTESLKTELAEEETKEEENNNKLLAMNSEHESQASEIQDLKVGIAEIQSQINLNDEMIAELKSDKTVSQEEQKESKSKADNNLQNYNDNFEVLINLSPIEIKKMKNVKDCPTYTSLDECKLSSVIPLEKINKKKKDDAIEMSTSKTVENTKRKARFFNKMRRIKKLKLRKAMKKVKKVRKY